MKSLRVPLSAPGAGASTQPLESSVGPGRRLAVPAVLAEFGDQGGAERTLVAVGDIRFYMLGVAHSDNRRADSWIRQNEANRHLGKSHALREYVFESLDPRNRWNKVFRSEIAAAPVAFREAGVGSHVATEAALVERDAGDYSDVHLAAEREEFVFGRLVEDVVDDLNGVHQSGADGFDSVPRLPAVQAETE